MLAPPRQTSDHSAAGAITLLLERRDDSGERFTTLAVGPEESIQSVKLRMLSRTAFTSRHCLVSLIAHCFMIRDSVARSPQASPASMPPGQSFTLIRIAPIAVRHQPCYKPYNS